MWKSLYGYIVKMRMCAYLCSAN